MGRKERKKASLWKDNFTTHSTKCMHLLSEFKISALQVPLHIHMYICVCVLWMYLLHTTFSPSHIGFFSWLCFKNPSLTSGRETWLRLLRKLLSWKKKLWQHLQSGTMWDKKDKVDSGGRIIETGSVSGSKILMEKIPRWKRKNSEGRRRWKRTHKEMKSKASLGAFTWLRIFLTWPHYWSLAISPWSLWVSDRKGWRLSTLTLSLALY